MAAALLAGAAVQALPAAAEALVEVGTVVSDASLPSLGGGAPRKLFDGSKVQMLVFFRPGQDRSREVLQELAACEKDLTARSVHIVGLVSSSAPASEVSALVAETGLQAPVFVDTGDALYGELLVRQHPVIIVTDAERKVTAVQPYLRLRFCDIVMARIQHQLGEIDDAQLAKVLDPGAAPMPSDDKKAVAKRHVMLGEKQLAKGNCAGALKSFEAALALDPDNAEAKAGKEKCAGK